MSNPKTLNNFCHLKLKSQPPKSARACHVFDAAQASPADGVAVGFSKPANVQACKFLFPKIDWIDRMIIAFKQHKTPVVVVQPVAGRRWRDLFLSLLGRLSFVLHAAHLPAWKNVTFVLDMSNRRVSIEGLWRSSPSPGRTALRTGRSAALFFFKKTINTGLLWLASRGGDDACSGNVGGNSSKKLRDETASSRTY